MEIGIDSIGVHAADLPENVVVMQIGVSRFGKTGLCRIGHVIPRAARKMVRALTVASEYLMSSEATNELIWELRGQPNVPAPRVVSATAAGFAPTARLIVNLALFVVAIPVIVVRLVARMVAGSRTAVRESRAYVCREFIQQSGLLVLTTVATAIAVYLIR
jgi:hypothetical protein